MRLVVVVLALSLFALPGAGCRQAAPPSQPPAMEPTPAPASAVPAVEPAPPAVTAPPVAAPAPPPAATVAPAAEQPPAPAKVAAPATPPAAKPAPVVKAKPATPAAPQTLTFAATPGQVTFAHSVHAKRHACDTCHPVTPPGKFDFNKEKAHSLCKGCHRQEGRGPTACAGCHKKS